MRILYVLTSLGVGGAEKQAIALAERMAARGHTVTFIVLKHTAEEILPHLPQGSKTIEKFCFSSCGADGFQSQLIARDIKQVIIVGIEAHICVTQTVLDLLSAGLEVHLLVDCITSRKRESKEVALARLTQAGAVPSNLEMALFEMMGTADSPMFKAVQSLIK